MSRPAGGANALTTARLRVLALCFVLAFVSIGIRLVDMVGGNRAEAAFVPPGGDDAPDPRRADRRSTKPAPKEVAPPSRASREGLADLPPSAHPLQPSAHRLPPLAGAALAQDLQEVKIALGWFRNGQYAALMAAAAESASRMTVTALDHFGHRVVLVVDADVLDEADDSTSVEIATPVAWARLAAVQADPDPIALDDGDDADLGWFANQEAEWLLERIKGDPST